MACSPWVTVLVTSVAVVTADILGKSGSARLRLVPGGNATCQWIASLLDSSGDNGGWEICTNELGFSFVGTAKEPLTTVLPDAAVSLNYTTEAPFPEELLLNVTAAPDFSATFSSGASGDASPARPEGFERLANGGFYKLHTRPRTWHDARAVCELEEAHLLVIETVAEGNAIREFLKWKNIATPEQPEFTLHAGFRLNPVTVQGESSSYERWDHKESYYKICGQIDNDAWLLYGPCASWKPFICEHRTTPPQAEPPSHEVPSAKSSADCSPVKERFLSAKGYVWLWNSTYVKDMGQQHRSWNEAKRACESDGFSMVGIESAEKAEALIDYMAASRIEQLYVGVKTGEPITVLGKSPSADYNRWLNKAEESCFYANNKLLLLEIRCGGNADIHIVCQVNESDIFIN